MARMAMGEALARIRRTQDVIDNVLHHEAAGTAGKADVEMVLKRAVPVMEVLLRAVGDSLESEIARTVVATATRHRQQAALGSNSRRRRDLLAKVSGLGLSVLPLATVSATSRPGRKAKSAPGQEGG